MEQAPSNQSSSAPELVPSDAASMQPLQSLPTSATEHLTAPAVTGSVMPLQQVTVNVQCAPVVVLAGQANGPGCLVRSFYFLFIGWWLSQVWIITSWFLNATIIGLPLGLLMLNRLPEVVTLKAARTHTQVTTRDGMVVINQGTFTQHAFVARALYFVLVGWWASLLWVEIAWLLCLSLLGLPFAFWMFERTPAITTLARR